MKSDKEINQLIKKMGRRFAKAGERIIKQGEISDSAYIIKSGTCRLVVEKSGNLLPVSHLGKGEIIGMVSLLTGEPQHVHFEAETDMEIWELNKELFDDISREDPAWLDFLTEILVNRLDSPRPIADRAIGKYVLTDIIGRGGYSIVYRGLHTGLNMPVAIKMMKHNMAMEPEFLTGFRNEAKTIASLTHDNIIKVFDIEEQFRTIFIIQELIEGESLNDMLIRLGNLSPKLAVDCLIQICSGLEYAHKKGIIHRDINSANIFVQRNDRIQILDFGLACPIGTEDFASLGTVAYMAPEQIESEKLDERTDIYALAITAYEMLTGTRPFPEDDIQALMQMHLNEDIPDPGNLVNNLPDGLREFILKAGRRKPSDRYQNAARVLEDLQQLSSDLGITIENKKPEQFNTASIYLKYKDYQKSDLKKLMSTISNHAKDYGIKIKAPEFMDI
jgi:serine/threonine protein kinase